MTLLLSPITAEVEGHGHPDILCSRVAAEIIRRLSEEVPDEQLQDFRGDTSVQAFATGYERGRVTPIRFNVAGQFNVPGDADLAEVSRAAIEDVLTNTGYFRHGDFSPDSLEVVFAGTNQSGSLNGSTSSGAWGDKCTAVGHYVADGLGMEGTFQPLYIGRRVEGSLRNLQQSIEDLRPDGKITVRSSAGLNGYSDFYIEISASHAEGADLGVLRYELKDGLLEDLTRVFPGIQDAAWVINDANGVGEGKFDRYFLSADHGTFKAKDGIVIAGGIHTTGTDGYWGKCAYKASSLALPAAFALSKVVSDVVGVPFASVAVTSRYGQTNGFIELNGVSQIDPRSGKVLVDNNTLHNVNAALTHIPSDPETLRILVGLPIARATYGFLTDFNFHSANNPWKADRSDLTERFRSAFTHYQRNPGKAAKKLGLRA